MIREANYNRLGKKKQLKLATFIVALITACAFFVPFIISGKGYFIFFGDFNVQQIPFYQYCHQMVRSGDFGWSWLTDLGSNFIGSYSFYLLGSPFFWITLLFPNSFVPYLMGPLLILKFAFAALTAYMFIRRFTARAETAMIGGLLYAFSGFSVYNIFFNHFHEAIIFFPLLLLAMELFISEKRRGLLIFAIFICALSNYFFFFGMVVFTIVYWFVRIFSHSFKFKLTEFLLMLLECVLGLALASIILFPTILEITQNSRLGSFMNGWGAVLFGKEQIFLNVIQCFFFPPDLPARPVFFPGADVKWSSLGGWLPLFGMTGVIAWLQSYKKGTWLRRVLVIFAFMALVPVLNSSFTMFNTSYYARWFFMPILLMCLATAIALEDTEINWNSAWRWSFGITLAFVAVIGFMPTLENGKITKIGLYTDSATNPIKYIYQTVRRLFDDSYQVDGDFYDLRFWVTCLLSILSLLSVHMLIPIIKEKKSSFFKPIIALICVISAGYSAFFIACGQSHSYEMDSVMTDALIEGNVSINEKDGNFSRVDVYDGVDNTGLYLGLPSINFFHSIVPASITDFYEFVGVPRTVGSRPEIKYSALRPLLSVKYLLDPEIDNSKEFADKDGFTEIEGYTFHSNESGYNIYENNNYIPMGFTYDYYMSEAQALEFGKDNASSMMLKALLIDGNDELKIKKYLTNIGNDYNFNNYSPTRDTILLTPDAMKTDCDARRKICAHSFKTSDNGFTAHISMDRENLVFFSVPYHDGWTAYVNGKKTEIFRVNKGFMAVAAPEGLCEINFKYKTPGLIMGIYVSLAALGATAIYLLIWFLVRRKHPKKLDCYPEAEVINRHIQLFESASFAAENPEDDYLLDNIDLNSIEAYKGFDGGFIIDDSALDEVNKNNTDNSQ